jgi:CelD/BcsL family acetyltransferase involved in cellulose biosynthesis
MKKLREGALGQMRLARFETPEEVSAFLEQAVKVSRKTYQWTLHQRGLSATDLLRRRLLFAAERGWMRSYLLHCGGNACAFLVGFQYRGRFLLDEIGFDPALAKYSVGTVLQLLTVEDLFNHNCPSIFDLQDYATYKEVLSTESYLQTKMFLFRRGAYSRFLRTGHHGCQLTTRTVSTVLDRLGWKSKIRKILRGWAGSQ